MAMDGKTVTVERGKAMAVDEKTVTVNGERLWMGRLWPWIDTHNKHGTGRHAALYRVNKPKTDQPKHRLRKAHFRSSKQGQEKLQ